MRMFLPALFVGFSVLTLVSTDALLAADVKATRREVIVPDDAKPFVVKKDQTVRLTGEGIGGGKMTAKVSGPATIVSESLISHVRNGGILIGADYRDYEIRPTGKGAVKVTITSIPPQPDAEPKVTVYQFKVK